MRKARIATVAPSKLSRLIMQSEFLRALLESGTTCNGRTGTSLVSMKRDTDWDLAFNLPESNAMNGRIWGPEHYTNIFGLVCGLVGTCGNCQYLLMSRDNPSSLIEIMLLQLN